MSTPRHSQPIEAFLSAALLALGGAAGSVAVAAARYRELPAPDRKEARRRLLRLLRKSMS